MFNSKRIEKIEGEIFDLKTSTRTLEHRIDTQKQEILDLRRELSNAKDLAKQSNCPHPIKDQCFSESYDRMGFFKGGRHYCSQCDATLKRYEIGQESSCIKDGRQLDIKKLEEEIEIAKAKLKQLRANTNTKSGSRSSRK